MTDEQKPKQRVERIDWVKLAQTWYDHQGGPEALYAGEIVDKLRQCGLIKSQHHDLVEWAKAKDKEDRRP